MRRREFVTSVVASTASAWLAGCSLRRAGAGTPSRPVPAGRIMTVQGWIDARDMGVTLPHEHMLASFQPYDEWTRQPIPYDADEVVRVVLPRLQRVRALGCRTFVDATAVGLGRDPVVLRRLAEASGLHVLTTTGAYAARELVHLPPYVRTDTVEALADRWVEEWTGGIEHTGVRPGFIKLGFNGRALSDVERRMIRAAALTHKRTGLTIGAHTGPAVAAFEQLDALEREQVHPSAWIWIHAQNEPSSASHIAAARRGAWVEFDGIDASSLDRHVDCVTRLRDAGLLDHVLVSQDAGWYQVGTPGGGTFRSYETIFRSFLPALRARGFDDAEIDLLMRRNPAAAFTVSVRG